MSVRIGPVMPLQLLVTSHTLLLICPISYRGALRERRLPSHVTNADVVNHQNKLNPKFVLRNHMAQMAIEKAEKGDFSEVSNAEHLVSDENTHAATTVLCYLM